MIFDEKKKSKNLHTCPFKQQKQETTCGLMHIMLHAVNCIWLAMGAQDSSIISRCVLATFYLFRAAC